MTDTPTTIPRIRLQLTRVNGHESDVEIVGDPVTAVMLEAAEGLLHALTTGDPPPLPKGLYDVVATAFEVSRDVAKRRILGALYGKARDAAARLERLRRGRGILRDVRRKFPAHAPWMRKGDVAEASARVTLTHEEVAAIDALLQELDQTLKDMTD